MSATTQVRSVKCPNCGKSVEWTTTQVFRPFCSERCKLIDLGEWAREEKKIAGEPVFSGLSENEVTH
jgi:endogenous inhibitor of DNA gyrase (YacG/DUF329 family)